MSDADTIAAVRALRVYVTARKANDALASFLVADLERVLDALDAAEARVVELERELRGEEGLNEIHQEDYRAMRDRAEAAERRVAEVEAERDAARLKMAKAVHAVTATLQEATWVDAITDLRARLAMAERVVGVAREVCAPTNCNYDDERRQTHALRRVALERALAAYAEHAAKSWGGT